MAESRSQLLSARGKGQFRVGNIVNAHCSGMLVRPGLATLRGLSDGALRLAVGIQGS